MSQLESIAGVAEGGTLYGIGVGPGDVRNLTLRAANLVRTVDVVSFFAKRGSEGHARRIVSPLVTQSQAELRLEYPVTTEIPFDTPDYRQQLSDFYRQAADRLAELLKSGKSVGLLAEGDPFFYGSFIHIWQRLDADFELEVIPGVTGMSGCWSRARAPITLGDDILTVVPGTLDETVLTRRLAETDAAVIMKIGRNLGKVRRAVEASGRLPDALYVERGTMDDERIVPLASCRDDTGPYFSMILIPGRGRQL